MFGFCKGFEMQKTPKIEFFFFVLLFIENMHHFYSVVRARKVSSLDPYVKQAKSTYDIHLDAYCKVVIRKPLGKLWVKIKK